MTVYVDDAVWKWRGKVWCHMTATTADELHAFARRLGLRRSWFQDKDHHQHYDLTEERRRVAVAMGAVEVRTRDYALLYRHLPIAAEWVAFLAEYEADAALGEHTPEEMAERQARRRAELLADRALRVKGPRRRG